MPSQPDNSADRQERRRLLSYAVAGTVSTGGLILALTQVYDFGISASTKSIFQALGFIILALPAVILMQAYLEPTLRKSIQSAARQSQQQEEIRRIRAETQYAINLAQHEINELKNLRSNESTENLIGEEFRTALAIEIRSQIERQVGSDFLDEIERQTVERIENTQAEQVFFTTLDRARARIETEIFDLGRRGNLNLILGGITSLSGVIILGVSVYYQTSGPSDTSSLLSYFLPRLGLAIMIQVFAYFFLSLYRNSLQEIKYFQNEITNIEAKHSALDAAMRTKDNKIIGTVLSSFATTERNHILLKNQTTVELEKTKAENGSNLSTLKILTSLITDKISGDPKK